MAKRNAFDEIGEILVNKDITQSHPASIESGANNFFEIDFPTVTNTDELDTNEIVIENKDTPPVEAQEEDTTTTEVIEVEEKDDTNYDDWNDLSLIALTKIREGKWDLDEKDIPKDLDASTLSDLFDAQESNNIEKVREEVYTQAGEFANYLKYLMDGGSPEVVADAMDLKKVALMEIDSEEDQTEVITAYLELKGLDEDLIKSTLETIFDKGKGRAEAEKAQEGLKKAEESILENQSKELEKRKAQESERYNQYIKTFTDTVKKGKLGEITIDDKKQKQIIDAFTKPTEIVTYTNPTTGKVEKNRITKSSALFNEVNSNPEKLASLVLWLLEGGSFEGLKNEVELKKDDKLREILKGRQSKVVAVKPKTTNAFEVLANRRNNY